MENNQLGFAPIIIVLAVAVVLVIGGAGAWYYGQTAGPKPASVANPPIQSSSAAQENQHPEQKTQPGQATSTLENNTNTQDKCRESKDATNCYLSLAKEAKDPSICEKIQGGYDAKSSCYDQVLNFFISLKDQQLCKKFPEYSAEKLYDREIRRRYECYRKIADLLKNPSICAEIDDQPLINSCYIKVAFDLKDPLICNKLGQVNSESLGEKWMELSMAPLRIEFLNSKETCAQISKEPLPWKIYQDKENGWEISYPNNFIVDENDDYIYFTSPENIITLISPEIGLWAGKYYSSFVWIGINKTTFGKTLEEWTKEEVESYGLNDTENPDKLVEKITVGNNIPAIKFHEPIQAYYVNHRYIKQGNIIIDIQNGSFSGSEGTSDLNQILSTFGPIGQGQNRTTTPALCGNGSCDAGETSVTCAADCAKIISCVGEGALCGPLPKKNCCSGYQCVPEASDNSGAMSNWTCIKNPVCGNGICEPREANYHYGNGQPDFKGSCPQDCKN